MKKILVLAAMMILLTGCSDSTELGNRAIIQAAAVDWNGKYKVSVLLFSSGGSGGDTIDASGENVIKVSGEGETLSEAIDNISLVDGKKIYMSETKLLILGGGFEEISVDNALDTLYFDMRCSLNMPVCCAENAEAITDLQFTEGITSAEKPLSMIENANEMGIYPKTTLLDLLADREGEKNSILARFSLTENGRGMTASENGETAVLNGSRYITKGILCGSLNETETAALMLMSGRTDKITLNFTHNNAEKTCEAYCVKITRQPTLDGKVWNVSAKFRTRSGGTLSEHERQSAMKALTAIVKEGAELD